MFLRCTVLPQSSSNSRAATAAAAAAEAAAAAATATATATGPTVWFTAAPFERTRFSVVSSVGNHGMATGDEGRHSSPHCRSSWVWIGTSDAAFLPAWLFR